MYQADTVVLSPVRGLAYQADTVVLGDQLEAASNVQNKELAMRELTLMEKNTLRLRAKTC